MIFISITLKAGGRGIMSTSRMPTASSNGCFLFWKEANSIPMLNLSRSSKPQRSELIADASPAYARVSRALILDFWGIRVAITADN